LLSNIYSHVLNKNRARYIKEFNVDTNRPHPLEYKKVARKPRSRKVARKLGLAPTDMFSDVFKRMKHVRYADGFIVRLTCSRAQMLVIKPYIKIFLQN
jgi:hypothetical protein